MPLTDPFNRKINYLRISVTDRCNLRCTYCMPESGITILKHEDILSFEEIESVTRCAVKLGIDKIRVTGGEPLVRKGITVLVKKIADIEGINDLSMTTNGQLLEQFAQSLAGSGLKRINISLDTCDPDKYREITRGGDIKNVVKGIAAAQKAGLYPVKLNCVVRKDSDEPDAQGVKQFAEKMGIEVRFIQLMDLHKGTFSIVEGGTSGDCRTCNRLRLTADGYIMPCLFSDKKYSVKELGCEQAIFKAVELKPDSGKQNNNREFYNIGG